MGYFLAYKNSFRAIILAVICIALITKLNAQTNISGVINKYAAVTNINFCSNIVTVNSSTGFFVGQKVMIIQMKGAEIDASNTASFGNITDYKGSGNYEINEIDLISGNIIEFKYAIMRDYQVSGAVQLVSLEEYVDAVVSAPLTAQAWDGSTGGVLLLKTNTLTLNDSITVKGKGFRGAIKQNDNSGQACFNNGIGGATDYYCATVNCGAPKGEGIGTTGYVYGRGKNGSGGGGGDDHNTGGGGGSNYGAGGRGGTRSNTSNNTCPGPAPGVGGAALTYSTSANKIFMGGGGGAGDGNNNELTSGANGGGIVIIIANGLTGNNKKINANANQVDTMARSDGAGGGGGGGTVLLFVSNYTGNVRVDAVGGNGGILDNGGSTGTNAFCMGPGAGGGGGVLWVNGSSVPGNITLVDTGGVNGKDVYGLGPANCPYGTTNGAQPGDDGGSVTDLNIPFDTIPFVKLAMTACCDTTVCPGQTILLSVSDTATFPPVISWSSGETTQVITPQVTTTTSFIVTVTDWRGCAAQQTLVATVLNAIPNATVCCDTTLCPGGFASFNVTVSPPANLTYSWSTGETTTGITKQVFASQSFVVTITDANGCSVAQSGVVTVNNNPPQLSVCCDTIVCAGSSVVMSATSPSQVTYSWSNGQTTASITPSVSSPTTFIVTVTDVNGCQSIQSVNAFISNVQTTITAVPDTSILLGQTVQLTASGDSTYTYSWSPAAGLSNAGIFNPVAKPDATTTYCVTATNDLSCTATACYKIELVQPDIKVPDAFTPNGDNVNDVFTIFPLKMAEILETRIYDRWGEIVFTSKGNVAWDGNYQGKPQPSGAYVCQVTYGSSLNPGKANTVVKDFLLIR